MSESKARLISRAIGRRKEATASVRLITGSGNITINTKPSDEFFPGPVAKYRLKLPFSTLSLSKYDASVKVAGGGKTGQLEAVVLGISRALANLKNDYKTALRGVGLLTRDSRERQRRMVGTGGKARRQKQSPKR
jgi:small subunit ribosomal protein S9